MYVYLYCIYYILLLYHLHNKNKVVAWYAYLQRPPVYLVPGITLDPLIQPSSLHFPSLALCFLCLVDRVAVSAVTPASSKVEELRQWSDRQVKSSRLSHTQLGNKMSAGREWLLSEHF